MTTATATKTAAPGSITKKRLTVAQAADQWEKAKRAIDKQKPLLEEAAEILKEHFEKTGRTTYQDRIALVVQPGKLILDQAKVRAFLGKKLAQYQKKSNPSKSLQLLK